jgi:uncharacterized membrane protein (UPF0127 family)
LLDRPGSHCSLVNERTGNVVAARVESAFLSRDRRQGLLGRDGLPAGSALILAPCTAIHTFFMRFPIDVLFVGRDGGVLKIREALGPWKIAIAWGAFATIECAAGEIRRSGTSAGDRLAVQLS